MLKEVLLHSPLREKPKCCDVKVSLKFSGNIWLERNDRIFGDTEKSDKEGWKR
ncbi:hypothetical protein Csa_021151 [Cucumis sativus]|uniref:Uncharacterized protein n=1 Tax=Cucumis sativus TaxID=3659 RepID=A0A0A0LJ26_CUCSA|nr:hypothetical protein Csa_021151 [Cucumis sativus]